MKRFLSIALVNLVLLTLFLEIVGAGLYLYHRGEFIYLPTHSELSNMPDRDLAIRIPNSIFHPYFGYTLTPGRIDEIPEGGRYQANNHGFPQWLPPTGASCCDFPTSPATNEYVIGVFGGSVATGFALRGQAETTFAAAIKTAGVAADKNIKVLNFALPGFRQPQQATALMYFAVLGQTFDLIINIDGFNEAVSSRTNWSQQKAIAYPADNLWGQRGRNLEMRGKGLSPDRMLTEYHDAMANRAETELEDCRSGICYAGTWVLMRYHRIMWHRTVADITRVSSNSDKTTAFRSSAFSPSPDDYTPDTVMIWRQASTAMETMARQLGAHYVHVLQPNQWYRPAGDFIPRDPDHRFKAVIDPVNKVYDAMLANPPVFSSARAQFIDGAQFFANASPRDVYIDDCCHYTRKGYLQLFERIAEIIAE